MAHSNEQRLRDGYAAFQGGDMEALRKEFFASDIIWHDSGRSPISGTFKGTDEVLATFAKSFELSGGTLQVEIHDCLANDEHAVVLGRVRAERPDGRRYEDVYTHVVHIEGGKITESWITPGDQHASDEFWS